MAKATGGRGESSKAELSVYSLPRKLHRARATVAIPPCSRPFLTGSDSQTEFGVTHSKQTTEKFLTGARTAISVSRKHISNRELTMRVVCAPDGPAERRTSASRAVRGNCFALSNRELLELEHAPTS